jgi:hypothetical protein
MLFRDYPTKDVYASIDIAISAAISSSDGVEHIIVSNQKIPARIESLHDWPTLPAANTSVYGQLGGVL